MIGDVIKSLNISQRKAASLIGMPLRTLESWLANVCTPSEWLERLAADELVRKVGGESTTADINNGFPISSLGDVVRSLGISSRKAATLIGIPPRTFQNWASGQRIPSEWVERLVVNELFRKVNAAENPANSLRE